MQNNIVNPPAVCITALFIVLQYQIEAAVSVNDRRP